MKRSDFYFSLPQRLIAQHPAAARDGSRLLSLDRADGHIRHLRFTDFPTLLEAGDCLVLNDSRVIPARLIGRRADTDHPVEVLLLERKSAYEWKTIVRPGRHVRPGDRLVFLPQELEAEVLAILPHGERVVRFQYHGVWESILDRAGVMPLPPYIHEKLADPQRYQTVYARDAGSAAAPTAGLHFTQAMLRQIGDRGVEIVKLTLHVGLGTFRPVRADDIRDHMMHKEYFAISEASAERINRTRQRGGRVVAVGTTSCRVLETVADPSGVVRAGTGWTEIFIYPGYSFRAVDAILTNFHLPESTLIMLISAFAGREHVMTAYAQAIAEEYRFFSFGDAMFIHGPQMACTTDKEEM